MFNFASINTEKNHSLKKERDLNMQNDFQKATARDQAAAEYFSSGTFLSVARSAIQSQVIEDGRKHAHINPKFTPKKADMTVIEKAFVTLKAEFPELDHLRIAGTQIIADTKKNSKIHKVAAALNHATMGY